ncbi:MAG: radical SAM protein, partial [Hadesarchaea archaeon]|nr:radical SAM protein [Hadesarchaea archaeon]
MPFEPFVDAIERVKRETKLFVSIHPGLMPRWLAHELGAAGVDMADFNFIGDDETIMLVLGIDRRVKDYRRTLKILISEIPYVAPHICVGLHAGKMRGERRALKMIS